MKDYLKDQTLGHVAHFLSRLALFAQKKAAGKSLSAQMLLHWMDGGGEKKIFSAEFLKDLPSINQYLLREIRPVFLTERKALLIGRRRIWGGIVARLKGIVPTNSQPQLSDGRWPISYEGLSLTMPMVDAAKLRLGLPIDETQHDLFYALHGFGLTTDVVMTATPIGKGKYKVQFDSWRTKAIDRYQWSGNKSIVIPNPDYKSTANDAVAPQKKAITFHYRHARRVESAGLAHSFESESTEWTPGDPRIMAPAIVDTALFRVTKNGLVRSRRIFG